MSGSREAPARSSGIAHRHSSSGLAVRRHRNSQHARPNAFFAATSVAHVTQPRTIEQLALVIANGDAKQPTPNALSTTAYIRSDP
eukprot:1601651-Alexandrium_andersonii.AAC.1